MKFLIAALLCVVIAAGAPALLFGLYEPLWLFGLTVVVLLIHAGDIKTTAGIGITPGVEEVWNEKLYGRKPKLGRVIAVKLPLMILTVVVSMAVAGLNPIASILFLAISGGITAKAVIGNIRLLY
jgi:hypothetical protein